MGILDLYVQFEGGIYAKFLAHSGNQSPQIQQGSLSLMVLKIFGTLNPPGDFFSRRDLAKIP